MVSTSVECEPGPRELNRSRCNASNVVSGNIKHRAAKRNQILAALAEQTIARTTAITKATSSASHANPTHTPAGIGSVRNSEGGALSMTKDTQRTTWCTSLQMKTGL